MNALSQIVLQGIFYFSFIYILLALAFYFVSDSVIFVPPKPTAFERNDNTFFVQTHDNHRVAFLYHPIDNAKGLVILSHGNAEDLSNMTYWVEMYNKMGYSAIAYDYPGYGISNGDPSEQSTYQAIQAVYAHATQALDYSPENIIIYGRSLGCAPSIKLASENPVGAVILEAPFATAFTVITHVPIVPFDKFRNIARIDKIKAPVLVIHGTNDTVIPFKHGQKIFQQANEPKQFYAVQGAGHNNIVVTAKETYWLTIKNFLSQYGS